jgi:carbonic anhydrase/acetyltransferase-like protein (isoleucine patch superfamily)
MIFEVKNKRPQVHDTVFVADSAQVMGDVQLGKNVSVWFCAVLRGDMEKITVGDNSNIQDGCVLHTDEGFPLKIGKGVVTGHRAVLHGCTVGDGALIGIGAIVLNGATVGRGAIIGAGALVTEGAVIGDGELAMGVPAKVVRKVSASEKKRITDGADHYVGEKDNYNSQTPH